MPNTQVKWNFGIGQFIMLSVYTQWQVTDNSQNIYFFQLRIPLKKKKKN